MTFCCVSVISNAVLGSSNEGFEACMGKMGAGKEMSDKGDVDAHNEARSW